MKTSNQDQVRSLPANLVLISGHNTRHPTDKEVLDSGLVESIRNTGQLTPGLGRPHPGIPGAVELCAGARRSIACRILERNFDVIVREMSDKDFIDAILIENLQREDPDPEAEAELIRLRIAEGMTPSEIAANPARWERHASAAQEFSHRHSPARAIDAWDRLLADLQTEVPALERTLPAASATGSFR